ncbi:hypothetical protein OG21DRAFT_803223 [Imleria badia]|nr:hypothetical protein OG21DRAFT_803223 [Imleria badia]
MSLASEPQQIQPRFNVVLFGESGAGKSSVINLILGLDHDVARTSAGASPCTLDARPYDVTIQGRNFRLFDTIGFFEPQSLRDPDHLIGSIYKAYRLVRYLSDDTGINLLVFCIRRGRITALMQQNYLLFHDFLCHKKVPTALVITHLEHEESMEDWWLYNHSHFTECGIHVVGHACITAKREFRDRYHVSMQVIHDLLIAHGCGVAFTQERVSWVTELFQKSLDSVGLRPRLDSTRGRAQKLREYGLREDEIAVLLVKIGAVDEDMAFISPPRSLRNALMGLRARIRTTTVGDIRHTI